MCHYELLEAEVECSLFISNLSYIIGLEEKTQFFLLFNILISVFPLCLQSAACIAPPPPSLYLPAPEFPLIDGETVSAQIQRQMNLEFMRRKASYKKEKNRRREINYRTMDLVPFHSSHYPVSEQSNSDGWELFSSVWGGGVGYVRTIGADVSLWSAAVGQTWEDR